MNAAEIERRMNKLDQDSWSAVNALEMADQDAIRKRAAFDLAYSKAFLAAEGAVETRKHLAVVETIELRFEADVADALVKTLIRRLKALEKRADNSRTTSSWHKAELALAQSGIQT